MFEPTLQDLVTLEPWRQRVGYPNAVDDLMWTAESAEDCGGEIDWETGSKKWHCRGCGYIGWATVTSHRPVLAPRVYYARASAFYRQERLTAGGFTERAIEDQMYFVMAAALRAAAAKKPDELRALVEGIARL